MPLTLIASPPNLVVSAELVKSGQQALGFFSFSIIGLAVLAVATLYMVFLGRHLLPSQVEDAEGGARQRSFLELSAQYRVDEQIEAIQITAGSPLLGRRIADARFRIDYGIRVLARVRTKSGRRQTIALVAPDMELRPGDILVIVGDPAQTDRLIADQKLTRYAAFERESRRWAWEIGAATVMVHPESNLIGHSIVETEFRTRYGLQVIGLRQGGEAVADFETAMLATGDSLFVVGPWSRIEALTAQTHDIVLLEYASEHKDIVPVYKKAPLALAILGVMVLLSVLNVAPLVVLVLFAAMVAVTSGCLSTEHAYRSIHWSSLVLVAGMLPLATALQQTGGSDLIVEALLEAVGEADPGVMLTVIFALTATLGLVLSNTASAVLVAPIAITAAQALEVSPYPFAIAVLIAASAAYSTPVSTPVVTLVVGPGKYGFMDFVKVGVPLLVLTWLVTLLVTPIFFPY